MKKCNLSILLNTIRESTAQISVDYIFVGSVAHYLLDSLQDKLGSCPSFKYLGQLYGHLIVFGSTQALLYTTNHYYMALLLRRLKKKLEIH